MPPKDPTLRITDMLDAIEKIEGYVDGVTVETFMADDMMIDAVSRNIGIIGEAANHVPLEIQQRYPNIAWAQIRGMRNVIIHQYSGVRLEFIWDTVQNNLPLLVTQLQEILANE